MKDKIKNLDSNDDDYISNLNRLLKIILNLQKIESYEVKDLMNRIYVEISLKIVEEYDFNVKYLKDIERFQIIIDRMIERIAKSNFVYPDRMKNVASFPTVVLAYLSTLAVKALPATLGLSDFQNSN